MNQALYAHMNNKRKKKEKKKDSSCVLSNGHFKIPWD
jgi:transketolase N-terminal domain/subunit